MTADLWFKVFMIAAALTLTPSAVLAIKRDNPLWVFVPLALAMCAIVAGVLAS